MLYQTIVALATTASLLISSTNPVIVGSSIEVTKSTLDTRAERIDAYYEKRDMPLAGHGHKMVVEADRCGLDWRLVAAIGVRESSGGKRLMNNNPFGWGSAKIPFEDFDHAIEVVTWNLCGENPNTAKYYGNNSVEEKLYYYNGSVIPSYTGEVIMIMEMIEETELTA